jgi:molybdopterin synthase sulfur carrier subunit
MIQVLYFASLREALKVDKEQLEVPPEVSSVAQLKTYLSSRGDIWLDSFSNNISLLVSINQQMASDKSPVIDGDEIAFFPPVTGG